MTITKETIAAAETLLGISQTEAERELMRGGLAEQREAALRRRAVALPDTLAPALRFDPRPPGFPAPAPQAPVRWRLPDPGPLPHSDADIAFAPAARLGQWIRTGALTSRRLTEIYLDRIAAHGARLDCYVTVLAERAREEARAADAMLAAGHWLGPLHGVPYALKDLFDAAGTRTTWGAEPWAERVAEADAAVVERLRAVGAVLLANSAVGALAFGDVWLGRQTRNPWNLAEGSSGSSAGSAAATAAGLCGFSIGTETLGSIVSPAERCGAVGLRPTYGRVSRTGCMALCWSLDKVGALCRGVSDTGMVLAAINGGDARDAGSIDIPFNHDAGEPVEGLRLGYLPAAWEAADEVDDAVLAAIGRLGFDLRPVSLPDLPYDSLIAILHAEAAARFEELTLSDRDDLLTRQDAEAWPNLFRRARFLSAVDHVQLDRLRRLVMQALDALFEDIDILIGPAAGGPMPIASNFTGHPCLHLRAGFTRRAARDAGTRSRVLHEVPHGVSLWGGLFAESTLLRFGQLLEDALSVAERRPPGFG